MATQSTDYGLVLKDTFNTLFKSENLVPLALGALIAMVISAVSLGIAAPAMFLGYTKMTLRVARGETVAVGDVFQGFERFGPAFAAGLLALIAIIVGSFVVVGGIILAFLFSFTFILMADKPDLGGVDALKASWSFVLAHIVDALVYVAVSAAISALLSWTVIGGIFAIAFSGLFGALLYLRVAGSAGSMARSAL